MVKEANTLVPYKVDPSSIVNEGLVRYKGIFRVTISLPEYERAQIKNFLEAFKLANMPPSRVAKIALHEGHGYEITQAEFIKDFRAEIKTMSDYKENEDGTIVAFGLEDPQALIESYNSKNALVVRATQLITEDQIRAGKVLDMIVFNFKRDNQITQEVSDEAELVNQSANPEQEEALKTFIR